jgi:hypothetical protein
MAGQPWRNRLIEALQRQALPRAYVQRLVEELSDHAADLSLADLSLEEQSMEAQLDLDARLGSPGQLAAVATREFQRRTFAGRHPVLTFLAGPFVAVIVTLVATLLLLACSLLLLDVVLGLALGSSLRENELTNTPPSAFEIGLMQSGNLVMRFVPFALSAWFFAALGRRCARPVWGVVACGIVAVLAFSFLSVIDPPGPNNNLGAWMMGFSWGTIGLGQVLQASVPLVLLGWVLWPLINRERMQPASLVRGSG